MRFAILLALLSLPAFAVNLTGHRFTDSYRWSLLDDSFSEKFPAKNVFLASVAHVHAPFYITDSEIGRVEEDIIRYNNVLTLGYTHYWSERFAIGLDLTAVENKVLDDNYTTLADSVIRGKYRITEEPGSWALSFNPSLIIPTGYRDNFTTGRSVGLNGLFVLEGHWTGWHLQGALGYGHAARARYAELDYRNLILTQLGLSLDVTPRWNVNFETYRNFTVGADERQDEGDYYLTAKHKTGESYALYGGGGLAGTNEVERNNYTVFFGVKWHDGEVAPAPVAPTARPTPRPKPVPLKTREQEKSLGVMVALDNIYFGNGLTAVTSQELSKLNAVLELWRREGDKISRVVLEGYASKVGDTAKNFALGQARTQAVAAILVTEGVPPSIISTVSYGDKSAQLPAEWQNRKVQFRVYRH